MTCLLRGAQNQGMRRTVRMRRARPNDAYLEGDALDAALKAQVGCNQALLLFKMLLLGVDATLNFVFFCALKPYHVV